MHVLGRRGETAACPWGKGVPLAWGGKQLQYVVCLWHETSWICRDRSTSPPSSGTQEDKKECLCFSAWFCCLYATYAMNVPNFLWLTTALQLTPLKKKLEEDLNHTQNWTQLSQDETLGSAALNPHLAEDLGQISRSL